MMNVESSMFSQSLSCRSPSQLRNRLDGLTEPTVGATARSRATSCAVHPTKPFDPESLSASSSRSGSLADLRRQRQAHAQSLGESLALWPVPLPAQAPIEPSPVRRQRAAAFNDPSGRPRASSMPIAPSLRIFPISETETGH